MKHKQIQGQEIAPLSIGGFFTIEHVRDGKVIDKWEEHNLVVNEGLDHILDAVLHGSAQNASWFVGIFEGNYTPVGSDISADIAANAVESIAYDEVSRPAWDEAAASAQSITNSANKATFTINASKVIYGAFLISEGTKGGATGVLFAASRFAVARTVVDDDQLLVTYTVAAASS